MSTTVMIISIVLLIVYITLGTFCSIAAWRSANKYQGRKLWARLTKISIVFGAILFVVGFLLSFANGVSDATKRQMAAYDNPTNQIASGSFSNEPSLNAT